MADSVETHVCARLMQRDIDIKKTTLVKATTGLTILIGLEEMLLRLHRYTLPSPSRYC